MADDPNLVEAGRLSIKPVEHPTIEFNTGLLEAAMDELDSLKEPYPLEVARAISIARSNLRLWLTPFLVKK